ncbi:hypothetical protein ACH5RR_029314 [Cinchona calisaya]|uniref:Uncharacterized protein n=1 Tax=Cinchona calisaya TaxID=153742 RepID=A0ABD2YWI8_9GENT
MATNPLETRHTTTSTLCFKLQQIRKLYKLHEIKKKKKRFYFSLFSLRNWPYKKVIIVQKDGSRLKTTNFGRNKGLCVIEMMIVSEREGEGRGKKMNHGSEREEKR